MKSFKYFSTFSGIGGFELGITNAWYKTIKNFEEPECVGYSEIDKYAISVYERHFKGTKNYGDITKINAEELPDFDCLVGGFPCQAFSIAGRRGGFEDTRGTLFFDLARILKEKQPRLFVFENVEGLLNHKKGRTFITILSTIDELGYDCQWQVLNSKDHGVPQNRKRIIIVGHLRGTPRPEVFPFGRTNETVNPASHKGQIVDLTRRVVNGYKVRKDDRAGALDANYSKGIANQERPGVIVGTLRTHKDGNGFREVKSGLAPTIPARAREDGSGQPIISIDYKQPRSKTRRGRVKEGYTGALDHDVQQGIISGVRIRRITPMECERLQAFPDEWTKFGIKEPDSLHSCFRCEDEELEFCPENSTQISDTQRYKMCGNAVTTNVIRDVFMRIL